MLVGICKGLIAVVDTGGSIAEVLEELLGVCGDCYFELLKCDRNDPWWGFFSHSGVVRVVLLLSRWFR